MINCKKHFIAACFSLIVPTIGFAEAPVVDDSDNFAIIDEQPGGCSSLLRSTPNRKC